MQVSRYLFLILLALALDCCSERQFDSKTEGEKLLRRDAEWADLATAGKDVEKVVSYWTEDAVLVFPGQPVFEGKAAIRAYVTASFNTPGFKIHWVSQKPVFSPDGKFRIHARHGRAHAAWAKWRYDHAAPSWNISLAFRSG